MLAPSPNVPLRILERDFFENDTFGKIEREKIWKLEGGKIKLIFYFSIFYFWRGTLGDGACGTDRNLRWKAIKMGLK